MKHKLAILVVALLIGLGAAGLAVARAQQSAPAQPAAKTAPCPCMQAGMMGPGGMGGGMMGMQSRQMGMQPGGMGMQRGMMGMCPMMVPGAKIEVKSIDNGAVITITSGDPKSARRIQIMAEMMRLMQELRSQQ